jgi:drug/metabolite transporter (DMT)-like permease
MWAFYTKALSAAPSAVHANIVNTSSNFIITALLGALIFGENLPPLWWAGAALLISGSVIIGRRDQSDQRIDKDKEE